MNALPPIPVVVLNIVIPVLFISTRELVCLIIKQTLFLLLLLVISNHIYVVFHSITIGCTYFK